MLTGAYLAKQGDTKAQALAEAIRSREAAETQKILGLQFGSPDYKAAVPYPTKPVISEGSDMVDNQKVAMPSVYDQIGQAPDPKQALFEALKAQGQTGKMIGQTLLAQKLKPPEQFNLRENEKRFIYNADTGTTTEIAKGNPKERVASGVNAAAAERLGFPTNPDLWTDQQRQLIDQEVHKKIKAGAPVTTNINTVMGKSLADVGPILNQSMIAAQGAIQSNENVDRIIKAASDKGFYGPGANVQLFAAQLADKSGLGGKDNPTKIKNTRDAVQGLAQLVLQGRKQMRGEGAITQGENTLAEKAISGDIGNLTAAEIVQLANAAKRVNNYTISSHEQKIKYAKSKPETAEAAPYYEVPYYNNSTVEYLGPVKNE
jgi:hypothetical protein